MRMHKTRLRVLLVTARYFPFIGGTETHVHEVAQRLARANVDVTILTTDPSATLPTDEIVNGVQIKRVRAWPAKRDYYFAPGIYRYITQGQWDIVHCQGYHTLVAPLAMLAALDAGIPYIVTFHSGGHSSGLRTLLRGIHYNLLRPLFLHAERLIAVSQFEADLFGKALRLSSDRFEVIPNGAHMTCVPTPCSATKNETHIVSLGRLERYKGHQRAIAAMPKVIEQRPDAHLEIIGSGPYEAELRNLAQRLGIAERVAIHAIPAANRQEMVDTLAQASLVTFMSDYESQGIAAMEALSLRRPVLVSHSAALGELADRGLARSVAPTSTAEQVAAAMLEQLRQPLVPAAIDLPNWDRCAFDLLQLYHDNARRVVCAFS